MANVVKKQLKQARKQEKQFDRQQESKNILSRIAAQKAGTPIPMGAQKKSGWFTGTEPQAVSTKTMTPEQEELVQKLSGLIPQGLQNLNLPGNQSSFDPIENEARRKFSQRSLPGLAERFAGLGNDRLDSGSFQQAREGAIGDFESQIASLRAQHGLQEQGLQSNNLFNSLRGALSPQFDYYAQPGQKSFARNTFDTLLPIAGEAAAGYLAGGPAGAALGGIKGAASAAQSGSQINGTGAGQNSFGFQGVKQPNWAQYGNGAQNMGYQDVLSSIKPF